MIKINEFFAGEFPNNKRDLRNLDIISIIIKMIFIKKFGAVIMRSILNITSFNVSNLQDLET